MTTQLRFFLPLLRIVIFLMIMFGIVPDNGNRSANYAITDPQTPAYQFSMSVQDVLAKKGDNQPLKYCWKCTCPYHADGNKKRKGTWSDEGWVETDEDGRGGAESDAHEKCERQATGKDCYFWKCSCTGPKRRRHCN